MSGVWYTATQPLFLPKLYLVERFARVDHVVVLDEAQWQRHGGHTRAEVRGANGRFGLSLPVRDKAHRPMTELLVVEGWADRLLRTLEGTYRKFPGWRAHATGFEAAVKLAGDRVCDVGAAMIRWIGDVLGLPYVVHRSLDLVPDRPAEPTSWMASFAPRLEATDYLQGARAIAAYFVPGTFAAASCRVWGQAYQPEAVEADLSVIDPLFRDGAERVRELIHADAGRGEAAGTARRMAAYE